MATSLAEIRQLALSLDSHEREVLAQDLVSSLEHPELTGIEEAWLKEAARRYREFKEGKVELVPSDEAFARIDREFGWK